LRNLVQRQKAFAAAWVRGVQRQLAQTRHGLATTPMVYL
jgi:hypothetical protein